MNVLPFLYHNEPFLIRFARRFTVHNPVCLSPVSGIRVVLILDVPALALVMHVCDLIHFLQSRLFALRTNREWVVGEVLKLLKLSQAFIAMINVDWHFILPSCKRLPACRWRF